MMHLSVADMFQDDLIVIIDGKTHRVAAEKRFGPPWESANRISDFSKQIQGDGQ